MLDLNEFVTFATVTETGSFSRAAERLSVSKALVSKHIGDLEHSLGVKLLNRTTRKIGLTSAGALFYERCRQLIADADVARQELERFRKTPGGTIKVSSAISFGRLHLVPAIARFLKRYPGIGIELDLSERFADLVTSGADVVIRSAEEPKLLSLVARRVAPMRWVLCATPRYLSSHREVRTPTDLVEHNCIVYSTNARSEWTFHGPGGVETVRVRGNYRANNADGVMQGALLDLGIAALPSMAAASQLREGRLVRLLPAYALPEKTLYAAYLPNPTMAQCVQTFVHFLVDEFGDHPYWDEGLEPAAGTLAPARDEVAATP